MSAPAGIANGDVLIYWAVSDYNATTLTFPAGFTKLTGSPLVTTFDGQTLEAAYKVAASESGTYDLSASQPVIGGVACFTGIDTTTVPYRLSTATDNNANGSPWSITSPTFGSNTDTVCDLLFIGGSDTVGGTTVHTGPTSYTVAADIGSGIMGTALAYQNAVASGVTGAATMTGTDAGQYSAWACYHIALKNTSATPTLELEGYRGLNDDGSESTATFAAAQDTGFTLAAGEIKRLRTIINATGDPAAGAYQLEYRKSGEGSWLPVSN